MNIYSAIVFSCMSAFAATAGVSIKERMERGTYNAVARAKVVLRCLDQDGQVVSNATVSSGVTLDGNPETSTPIKGVTDKDGCFVVEGRSNGEIGYLCAKEGYYDTWEVKRLANFPEVYVSDGRWQPYGMTNTVVLKRVVNPVKMYVRRGMNRISLPPQNEWVGFDLECSDWIAPHGSGKHEDFQVLFSLDLQNERWLYYKYSFTLRFSNAFDGFYRMKKDETGSRLRCVYEADTNRMYKSEITFTSERRYDNVKKRNIAENVLLTPDDYLVLRVRSETDKDNRLVKANYAKLFAPFFAARYGFLIESYFNPNVNDLRLEADTTRNLRDSNDLGFAP